LHSPLRVGTLSGIVSNLAQHHHLDRDALLTLLFS
jgi:hypothetical protein